MASSTSPQPQVKILELVRVKPSPDSPNSAAEFSLQLTCFDTFWLKISPVERLFFYQLTNLTSTPAYFNSEILPKLKHSLSLTLPHFLPLAGNLRWPSDSPKPIIIYTPPNDGVWVTVAESNSNFALLTSNEIHDAHELPFLVPHLMVSDDAAPIIALQITLFPSQGFSIGIAAHHAAIDGKSSTMFMKSWAYLCKQLVNMENEKYSALPPELTPFLDRIVIKDPTRLDLLYVNQWLDFTSSDSDPNRRSLMIAQSIRDIPDDLVRATFNLSREDINKLREKVLSYNKAKPLHLSSFVLTFAYASTCLIKTRGGESDRSVYLSFVADARSRLDPPIPENYFGNCVSGPLTSLKARNFMDENGFAFAAELVSDMVKEVKDVNGILAGAEKKFTQFVDVMKETGKQLITVTGSPRFGVYGADFGWGKPSKVEVVSHDRGGAIALAESRDGNGGIEIGLALDKLEMETFASLFVNGL